MVRAFASATGALSAPPTVAAPQRGRPWDARSEFADTRAVRVLRTLANRKVRTVHDEPTFRHWLGRQTNLPFAERDSGELSAADIEMLTRHLSSLPDLGAAHEISRVEHPPTGADSIAEHDRLIDDAALRAAALIVGGSTQADPAELER
jgi:hypothetical protein